MGSEQPVPSSAKSWAVAEEEVVSLADIMAEELQLAANGPACGAQPSAGDQPCGQDEAVRSTSDGEDCASDYMIAKLLQSEFDRESDAQLKLEERKFNKTDKVSVSFDNFKACHEQNDSDSSDLDDDYLEYQNNKLDSYKKPKFGPSGVIFKDGAYVSKHDKVLCGRINTAKVLNFPPEFRVGDAAKLDLKLSNRVYNHLKKHSVNETKRQHRFHEKKEKSTSDLAVDSITRMELYKLINSGYLQELTGIIATGKEAAVFHSTITWVENGDGRRSSRQVAVKIYKTTLMEFKNRALYVRQDYRFKNPRKVLRIWAEREFMNLNRLRKGGVRVPTAHKVRSHLLIMDFIGSDDREAAPKLKDVELEDDEWLDAYDQVKDAMVAMYGKCGLVHADMSEFNLLYWRGDVWVIDLAQAVDIHHQDCLMFLARDCENIFNFFSQKGVEGISARELFNAVAGTDCKSDETFAQDVKELASRVMPERGIRQRRNPAEVLLDISAEDRDNICNNDFSTDRTESPQ